ncbi:hypothetical protein L1987_17847 [Smallanthus sonchifolius]|uniref:Uncharacterized protein n=1 Tax=Smallanthus sonchifolius TaxID=185202 RepID=A0ACB9J054_9ASTR|nr:hypothetical protein L1987_17847 [Smallanthus sonchifolius]
MLLPLAVQPSKQRVRADRSISQTTNRKALVADHSRSSMATTPDKDGEKPKHRPVVRIGIFIIVHSLFVSVVCCTAGVLALLLLPVLAKKTYVSENALLPGSASPMVSDQDVSGANRFINELISTGIEVPRLIAPHMTNLGGEVSYHKFQTQSNKFLPLHFFTSPNAEADHVNKSCGSYGTNIVGIIRAPRGDGKEAIVLVTPYNPVNLTQNEVLSLGIAYTAFSLLTQVSWLAKDIIWLAADSQYGQYNSVADWLREYHTPSFDGFGKLHGGSCHGSNGVYESELDMVIETEVSDTFTRTGTMAAALVVKVANRGEEGEQDALNIYAEASNGQMPYLDLINVMERILVCRVGNIARRLNPQWKFGIPVKEYVEGSATLISSLYHQALGVPTGSHGAFRDYQVDAITMEISLKLSSTDKGRQTEFLFRVGRLIEGVVRSVNNLLEKFHQSFFLYLLTSSNKFISVGVYMIAFLLLVAPPSFSLLPYFIYQIPNSLPTSHLLIWASLSLFIPTVLGSFFGARSTQWELLKSVTVSTTFTGLCLMSVINFATAEIGALLLVPMCLMSKPWRLAGKAHSALNLVLVVIGFPGAAFFVVKSAFGFQNGSILVEFWYWMESLWAWNSATYIYICMLQSLCLSGIRAGDYALNWLWNNCSSETLSKLVFENCNGIGDHNSFECFIKGLKNLHEIELNICRSIITLILLKLAENRCDALSSLLIYDGGNKESLLHFIRETRCNLQKLDLRLPLDLDDSHLFEIGAKFNQLRVLRLQSCTMVTGEGLKTLGLALSDNLEELALTNCDVMKRQNGFLVELAQNLRNIKILDLSYNHTLLDKEFASVISSYRDLQKLKLRGCSRLTDVSLISLCKNCKRLKSIDLLYCHGFQVEGVEFVILNSPELRNVQVEDHKLSEVARRWMQSKFIEVQS